jgi:uncharacterized protein YndB with AHSA1/START domain
MGLSFAQFVGVGSSAVLVLLCTMALPALAETPGRHLLKFERVIAAPLDDVWRLVTIPEAMNQWSEARVELEGDAQPDLPGTERLVTVRAFGLRSRLYERIEESSPPNRLVYIVVRGGMIRNHRGEVLLTPVEGGTRLIWTVQFSPKIPLTGWFFKAVLRPALNRSLDELQRVAAAAH